MCIFCEIIKGEKPSYKIYEDEVCMGILDVFPVTEGHVLVIPKKHYEDYKKIPEDEWKKVMEAAKKIAEAAENTLEVQGMNIATAPAAIRHFHIHVIPRYDYDLMGPLADLDNKRERDKELMEDIYKRFKKKFRVK
jgi:histidine triad (HIT) family protein